MHILLIHQAFTTVDEAGGTRHYELARYLSDYGHRVTVIASQVSYLSGQSLTDKKSTNSAVEPWITILRSYTYPLWHRSFVHRVLSFISFMVSSVVVGLQVKDVDLVWGTSPPLFQGGSAWLLAKLKRARFLFEVRDLWPAFAIQVGVLRHPLLILLSERFERFLYRQADEVMINSPGFKEHVEQRGAKHVSVVPNGTDTQLFDPNIDGNGFRSQVGLEGKYVVLYAGAHGLSNDLGVVLQAAALLQAHPHISIVFVGDGKEKTSLINQANALGLSNVLFLSPVSKREMPRVLAGADMCLAILKPLPLYKTVYPNKVFDYLAAGKGVLLAIDGVIRQVLENAQAGLFVTPGDAAALADAILFMAEHIEQGKQMGINGRNYVKTHFERAKIAASLNQVIETIVLTNP